MSNPTLSQKWNDTVRNAQEALEALINIQQQIDEKLSSLSEEEQDSAKGLTYAEICDLDLQEISDRIGEVSDIVVDKSID